MEKEKEKAKKRSATRREFIVGTTAAAAGMAVGAAAGSLTFPRVVEARPWLPEKWDYEADVVVVGYGGAGAVTAITAHDKGTEVLILEKNPADKHTPNTKMCYGLVHYTENPTNAEKYFKALAFGEGLPPEMGDFTESYPRYPKDLAEEIARVWVEGLGQTADWLHSLGLDLETATSMAFPTFPGKEDYITLSIVAKVGVVEKSGGQTLFKHLSDAVDERGITVLWETPGKQLIHNGQGEVFGVIAQHLGKEITIKARRAVVLTTGGFEYDEELKNEFLPGWKWVFIGNPGNTGDGIRMAMGVGAALGHMHHNAARVITGAMVDEIGTGFMSEMNPPGAIIVDNYGRRYANEDWTQNDPQRYQFYNLVVQYDPTKLEYPRIPSWFIFDEKVREKGPIIYTFYGAHAIGLYKWSQDNRAEIEKEWILQGDTVEELASKIARQPENHGRMDAAVLKETIARFNQLSETGKDTDFERLPEKLGPLNTPPYYATALYPGGPNTEGGPIRNAKAQIISSLGKPIRRLYSAGELGSVFSFAYRGGGNISECIIFGRIAGENATAETPWE